MGSVDEPLAGFEAVVDDGSRSYLEELVETPVGRRWLLKAGLASAVALAVGSRAPGSAQAAVKARHRRRTERTDLHFAFGHVRGVTGFFLLADGKRIALKRHTKRSREALRRKGGLWAEMDLSQLSHYVSGVELPAERAIWFRRMACRAAGRSWSVSCGGCRERRRSRWRRLLIVSRGPIGTRWGPRVG